MDLTQHIQSLKYIDQTRLKEIERYYHVSPPDKPKETSLRRRLWLSKVDVVLDQLRESSQRYRAPSFDNAVDECMMRATGRPSDSCKPVERGFEFRCLVDDGYKNAVYQLGFRAKGLGSGQGRGV